MSIPRRIVRGLYQAARIGNDITTVLTGDPKRILRHYANKGISKLVSKLYLRG